MIAPATTDKIRIYKLLSLGGGLFYISSVLLTQGEFWFELLYPTQFIVELLVTFNLIIELLFERFEFYVLLLELLIVELD
jgi:hypothetical protein